MPRDCCTDRAAVPVLSMAESEDSCVRRFRAAVDVIQNLPKNGAYRPSYEVMLRFYGLYKQAVCGPCRASRPGFWDPVGRYKWDAWSHLGEMSSSAAMTAYVEEMKKVAQEVIDTMPMNEKTASLFHYFEPLYLVIHDMPRPPEALLNLRAELEGSEQTASPTEAQTETTEEPSTRQEACQRKSSDCHSTTLPDGLILTSDSESEVFCDSLEQLDQNKASSIHSELLHLVPSNYNPVQDRNPVSKVTQVGAGQGGEGAGEGRPPPMRGRGSGREMRQGHRREETRGEPRGGARHPGGGAPGPGGGDGWEGGGGAERAQDAQLQLQQQIVSALRRLREDMHSVMERLEAVERLAAAQAQNAEWRSAIQFSAPSPEESQWWPFDVSGRTMLLLLLWPFVAQGLVFLLRRAQKKPRFAA